MKSRAVVTKKKIEKKRKKSIFNAFKHSIFLVHDNQSQKPQFNEHDFDLSETDRRLDEIAAKMCVTASRGEKWP